MSALPIPYPGLSGLFFNSDGTPTALGLLLLRDIIAIIDRTGGIVSDGVSNANVTATGGASNILADWMASLEDVVAILADGDKGDIVLSSSATVWTIDSLAVSTGKIANDAVTYAKLQNVAGLSVVGRSANSSGDAADITGTANQFLQVSNGNVLQFVTVSGDIGFVTGVATIANDAVTFAKMQNIATDSLIGRDTAGTGDPENITLNATLEMNGAGVLRRAALAGDVTAPAGSNTTTIANDAVTYAKMQNVSATSRLLGRVTAGAGDIEEITLSADLAFSGGALRVGAFTGDITKTAGSLATSIGAGVVTYAMHASASIATAANFWANTASKLLDTAGVWNAADPVTVTYAATTTFDFSTFINAKITLTNNVTFANPSNGKVGQSGCIEVIQDGTGSRTATWGSNYVFQGGTDLVLSTTASARDLVFYQILDDGKIFVSIVKDAKN